MSKEKPEVEFLGFVVETTEDGFKMPASAYKEYMKKEENIDLEILSQIQAANKALLKKGLKFCGDKVVENGGVCRLTIATEPGNSIYAQVTEMAENKGGIQPANGETVRYGACKLGAKMKVDGAYFKDTKTEISDLCKAAYEKRNKK